MDPIESTQQMFRLFIVLPTRTKFLKNLDCIHIVLLLNNTFHRLSMLTYLHESETRPQLNLCSNSLHQYPQYYYMVCSILELSIRQLCGDFCLSKKKDKLMNNQVSPTFKQWGDIEERYIVVLLLVVRDRNIERYLVAAFVDLIGVEITHKWVQS